MPKLIRLYIQQVILGFVLSAAFVAGLLYTNVGNLWHLVSTSDVGLLAAFLLWLFNGIVFAGVQYGLTIMRMHDDGTPPAGGKRMRVAPQPVPVTVPAKTPRRRVL